MKGRGRRHTHGDDQICFRLDRKEKREDVMTAECGVVLKHWEETVERVARSPADLLGSKGWVVIPVLYVSRVLRAVFGQG